MKSRTHIRGVNTLVATLPNGRTVWLQVNPSVVSLREMDKLVAAVNRVNNSRSNALRSNAAATRKLARSLQSDTANLTRLTLREEQKLRKRHVAGDSKREQRIDAKLKQVKQQELIELEKQTTLLQGQGRRALWDQLVLVSTAPLMAAYGQRGTPWAANNLVMALGLGVWLVGDEISGMFSAKPKSDEESIRGTDIWSYLAPAANLLTGWWLLGGQQHERFVTGIAEPKDFLPDNDSNGSLIPGQYITNIDLSPHIAREHWADFHAFTDVPALATIQKVDATSAPELLSAQVGQGTLRIRVKASNPLPPLNQLHVAWAVDTADPSG